MAGTQKNRKETAASIEGIMCFLNSTCGGYDSPRAFAKRRPLTQVEKTPQPLPQGCRNLYHCPCESGPAGQEHFPYALACRQARGFFFLTSAWNPLPRELNSRSEECYWGHLTSPVRHPFANNAFSKYVQVEINDQGNIDTKRKAA